MSLIVCDSGPIIHLREANVLHLLENCGSVIVPEAVVSETTNSKVRLPDWIGVRSVPGGCLRELAMYKESAALHGGEAECIAIARNFQAQWFITDDSAARYFASSIGLEVHGTLGIILYNVACGFIDVSMGEETLKKVREGSLYISNAVFEQVLEMLSEI